MPIALEQFVKQLEDSGIVTPGTIREFLPPVSEPKDAAELARALIRNNHLTKYQAEQIVRGKAKSLFLGNYVLLDKIGQGGMGQVFKAQHRRMERVVAVKVLPSEVTQDPAAIARFEREVRMVAKLDHRNIVTAYDADQADGVHFLVMQFVDGSDLSNLVKKNGACNVDEAVDYIIQAARGLEAAHAEGVVHRDVKPANLLLDRKGTVKILDMGLARILSAENLKTHSELTATGAVMGTVDFMPPEQALDAKTADARADVYSLGCTLYYLLTGTPIYAGDSLVARLLAHRERPIPSLRSARADVPEQLDDVFRMMVAKNVEDRYQTMTDVITDLNHLRSGTNTQVEKRQAVRSSSDTGLTTIFSNISLDKPQALVAKNPSPTRLAAPVPRRAMVAGGFVGALILLAMLVIIRRMPRETVVGDVSKVGVGTKAGQPAASKAADPGPATAPLPRLTAPRDKAGAVAEMNRLLSQADGSVKATPGGPINRLALVPRPMPIAGVLGWTIETRRHRGIARDIAYDPDGRWLALASVDGTVRLYDTETGHLQRVLLSYDGDPQGEAKIKSWSLAWHPGGRILAVGTTDNAVRLWDTSTGRILRALHGLEGPVVRVAWSSDGKALACDAEAGPGEDVCSLWVPLGKEPLAKRSTAPGGRGLAWSPDGRYLATYSNSQPGNLEVHGVLERSTKPLARIDGGVTDIAWSPDGARIATSRGPGNVTIWDAQTGMGQSTLELPGAAAVAWSPDGAMLAGGAANYVKVWNAATGRTIHTSECGLPSPPFAMPYSRLSWSPDGRRLAGKHSLIGFVSVWAAQTGGRIEGLEPQPASDFWDVYCWWAPDGKRLALSTSHRLDLIELANWQVLRNQPLINVGWGASISISPDWQILTRLEDPTRIRIEEVEYGREVGEIAAVRHGPSALMAAWSPDGKLLAIGSERLVQIVNIESRTETRRIDGRLGRMHAVAWSPDGTKLAAGDEGLVSIYNVSSGELLRTLEGHQGLVVSAQWSPDGKWLASGSNNLGGELCVWNAETGECRWTLNGHLGVGTWGLRWQPDGRSLWSTGGDRALIRWDLETGKPIRRITNAGTFVSPDGKILAGADECALRLFDFESAQPIGAAVNLPEARSVIVSPDGHYRGTAGIEDEIVYVVRTESGQQTLTPAEFAATYKWKNVPGRARFAIQGTAGK